MTSAGCALRWAAVCTLAFCVYVSGAAAAVLNNGLSFVRGDTKADLRSVTQQHNPLDPATRPDAPLAPNSAQEVYYISYNDVYLKTDKPCKRVRKLAQSVGCSGQTLWVLGQKRELEKNRAHRFHKVPYLARKMYAMLQFLRERKHVHSIAHNPLMCFLDGFDVINIRPLRSFKKHFDQLWRSIRVQGLKNTAEPPLAIFSRDTTGSHNINTGVYCGYAHDLEQLFTMIEERYFSTDVVVTQTDQWIINEVYRKEPNRFRLAVDLNQTLFGQGRITIEMPYEPPVCPVEALERLNDGGDGGDFSTHDATGSQPFFIHWAGDKNKIGVSECEILSCPADSFYIYDVDHQMMTKCYRQI